MVPLTYGKGTNRLSGQASEYPPTHGGLLGPKRIDWKKKRLTNKEASIMNTNDIEKEDGGGDGDGEGTSGTVFTSTNAGIFTPTYGGNKTKPKDKKKSTGIERLGRFLTDGSPVKLKNVEKSAVLNLATLLDEVRLDLRKEKKQVPYGSTPTEDDPPQMVERNDTSDEAQEPKKQVKMPKSEEEIRRDKLMDEEKQRNNENIEPHVLNLQQWGSGNVESDSLKRGGKDDILTPPPESDEEEKETTIPEDPDLKVVGTEGYEKYLKNLQKMEEDGEEVSVMKAFWKAVNDDE